MSGRRRVRDFQKTDPHLRDHPAFLRFRAALGVSPDLANGMLAGLWAFAFKFAQDGDLSRFNPTDLELSLAWERKGAEVWKALHVAGFISDVGILHDWGDWGGALFTERHRESGRKWEERNAQKKAEQEFMSGYVRECPGTKQDNGPEEKRREEKREEQEQELLPIAVATGAGSNGNGFDAFWTAYPRSEGKKTAQTAWSHITKAERVLATGVAQIMAKMVDACAKEKQYIPYATTFIHGKRWEDWRDGVPVGWQDQGEMRAAQQGASIDQALAGFEED